MLEKGSCVRSESPRYSLELVGDMISSVWLANDDKEQKVARRISKPRVRRTRCEKPSHTLFIFSLPREMRSVCLVSREADALALRSARLQRGSAVGAVLRGTAGSSQIAMSHCIIEFVHLHRPYVAQLLRAALERLAFPST